jgi:uncharacterized protein
VFLREDFHAPLGMSPRLSKAPSKSRVLTAGLIVVAMAGLGFAGKAYWPRLQRRASGVVMAPIEIVAAPVSTPTPVASVAPIPPVVSAADIAAGQVPIGGGDAVDTTGVIKIVRAGGGGASGAMIIDVGEALGTKLPPAPDKRLVEKTHDGILPRIASDGSRALGVYARPVMFSDKLKRNAPRVAILVGGVGLEPSLAADAIKKLPPGVTLALAPYGDGLDQLAASARENGHEIWLQAPMEGFGVGQNPGPHTLLQAGTEADNIESLHWLMGRFVGYVGIVNYLGGKFTGDAQALTPVLRDIADRGLAFLDDGTSARSLVREIAGPMNLPSARADIDLDVAQSGRSLDAALLNIEAQARANGFAIAVTTALPGNLDAIARFARELEGHGVALVPVSALLNAVPTEASAGAKP